MLTMGMAFVACSDDDEKGGGGDTETSTPISIPASVVDGVRISKLTNSDGSDALEVTYHNDGTIDKAVMNGQTFDFEYEPSTRGAVATGREIKRITCKTYESDGEGDHDSGTWVLTGFQFNTDGFLIGYHEEYTLDEVWDDEHLRTRGRHNCTLNYNAKGRLLSNHYSGSWSDSEGEGGNVDNTLEFTYKGDVLEKAFISDTDEDGTETITFSFGYNSTSPSNYYNIMTPQLAASMSIASPVLYLLAMTGYLGNASATLPSSFSRIDTSSDGGTDSDTYTLTYNMWDNQRVKDIIMMRGGYQYAFWNYDYFVQE